MEFSSQEKNKRCEDFWRREHAKKIFQQSEKNLKIYGSNQVLKIMIILWIII